MSIATVYDYRRVTDDFDTPDDRVTDALTHAQADIETYCQRPFDLAQRTERVRVYPDGRAYPSATPLVAVPTNTVIDGSAVILGFGYYFTPLTAGYGFTDYYTPQTDLTYTGGYAAGEFPEPLVRACCQVAWNALHPVLLAGVAQGATSVKLGDVEMAGRLNDIDPMTSRIKSVLRKYARRPVEPF